MRLTGSYLYLICCSVCANLIGTAADRYYKLWSSKFESVYLEIDVLRGRLLESEKQLGETRAQLSALAQACDGKAEVDHTPGNPVTVTTGPILEEGINSMLLKGFHKEKQFVRNLEKQLEGSLAESQARLMSRIDELERKTDFRLESMENKARLTNTRLIEMEGKLQFTLSALSTHKAEQSSLSDDILDIYNIIQELSNRGCQSGSFGDHKYPGLSFPKTYRVNFRPPFLHKPNFMHALKLLDSDAIVRVSVELLELSPEHATVKIQTWADTRMWGARVEWMACP